MASPTPQYLHLEISIVEAYQRLGNSYKVADELNIAKATVLKYLKRAGVPCKPKHQHVATIISIEQAAWLAGFIDGEGYFGFATNRKGQKKRYCQLRLIIANTNKQCIDTIKQLAGGGSISCRQLSKKNPNWSDCYVIAITGNSLRHVIKHIRPYCIVKRAHLDLYDKFIADDNKSFESRLKYKEQFELLARNCFKLRLKNK